jgi:hypothetical protein
MTWRLCSRARKPTGGHRLHVIDMPARLELSMGRDAVRKRLQMIQELANAAPHAPPGHVVRRETTARRHLRPDREEVVLVPLLVGVREHEVERPRERGHDLVRVAEGARPVRRLSMQQSAPDTEPKRHVVAEHDGRSGERSSEAIGYGR